MRYTKEPKANEMKTFKSRANQKKVSTKIKMSIIKNARSVQYNWKEATKKE